MFSVDIRATDFVSASLYCLTQGRYRTGFYHQIGHPFKEENTKTQSLALLVIRNAKDSLSGIPRPCVVFMPISSLFLSWLDSRIRESNLTAFCRDSPLLLLPASGTDNQPFTELCFVTVVVFPRTSAYQPPFPF